MASVLPSFWKSGAGRLLIPECNLRSGSVPAASVGERLPRVDSVWLEYLYLGLPGAARQQCMLATTHGHRCNSLTLHQNISTPRYQDTVLSSLDWPSSWPLLLVLNVSVFAVYSSVTIHWACFAPGIVLGTKYPGRTKHMWILFLDSAQIRGHADKCINRYRTTK